MQESRDFRRLVETSPDGMLVLDGLQVLYGNPAAATLLSSDPAALPGSSLLDRIHPTQHDRLSAWLDGLSPGIPARLDVGILQNDGSLLDVEISAVRVEDGTRELIQAVLRDISERKRNETTLREREERLSLAFAGAQEGVWDWNLETGAVVYSPRWKSMLGYEDDEIEPHVSAWERLVHPDDRGRAVELSASLERGATTYEGEFRLRHRQGHYLDVLTRGFPVRREPGGPVVRIVGTHFDLTERKRTEAERARTELLARLVFAQEDERRRIAREMHDQFGEQLTALARGIEDLRYACAGDAGLLARVEAVRAVAQQLDRDVDQLVWDLRPTALDDLGLRAALVIYVHDWSKRVGIPAAFHSSGLLDERLPSDLETTFYRIAQEALTNVAKHSRARQVEVILDRQPGHVSLVIEDDGVGFASGTEGQGFGLVGMRERAALVGATLEIESGGARGTTILVRATAPNRW